MTLFKNALSPPLNPYNIDTQQCLISCLKDPRLLCYKDMRLQKFRWSKVYESTEEELQDLLDAIGINGERTHLEAFSETIERRHTDDLTIWCAEGSFSLRHGGTAISMQPGDALRIPSDTTYSVSPGISGCAFYDTVGVGKEALY